MSGAPAVPLRVRVRGGKLFRRVIAPALALAVCARFLTPQRAREIACRWVDRHIKIEVME